MIEKVIYLDEELTTIEVLYEEGNTMIMTASSEAAKQAIRDFGGNKKVLDATRDYFKASFEMEEAFSRFLVQGDLQTEPEVVEVEVPMDLTDLLTKTFEVDDLFKLKIAIFDQDCIRNSKDRELKSKIRKSKDLLEIIALYHSAR